jgi:hypothetical protein
LQTKFKNLILNATNEKVYSFCFFRFDVNNIDFHEKKR